MVLPLANGGSTLAEDLLSGANAIAQFTGLSCREIYYLAEKGALPIVRKGRRLFARKSELLNSFSAAAENQTYFSEKRA